MKNLNKIFVALLLVFGLNMQAQDSDNPWAVSFGINAVDTRTSAGGSNFLDHFDQPFRVNENWNVLPSLSYLNVSKYVGDGFSFGVTGSVNKITKVVRRSETNPKDFVTFNPGDLSYYAVDGAIKYSFMNLIKSKVIDPSLHVGGGYVWMGDNDTGTINGGLGLTIWFTETIGLQLQSTYKKSFTEGEPTTTDVLTGVRSHFQHMAGLTFKFGGKDTDDDGIYDKDDACPDVKGPKELNGCPDTDGDGVLDKDDTCPDLAGLATFQGCPDTDGDGVQDSADACVDVPGLAALQGCPDADGDGITDKSDKCPTVKGPKENDGCPIPVVLDADKDGVPDLEDACPIIAGPASNKGCPEVTKNVEEELRVQARAIFFNTGNATLSDARKGDNSTRLDAIKEILKNYPNAKFVVEGHTDNVGNDKSNQKLSEARAKVVMDALIAKGVNPANLSFVGYGETKPVADNKTAEGKALNRRTEVIYVGGVDGMKVNKK